MARPFYLSPRGFVTGLVPVAGRPFTAEFDLLSSSLVMRSSDGIEVTTPLESGSIASFHKHMLSRLAELGVTVAITPMPAEIPDAVRFDLDLEERLYNSEVAVQYWRALLEIQRVFQLFRTRFVGKVSPIHLFWGAFDLALTRFSGRPAPRHPGGAPFLNDAVAREAYGHEVSSAGFWPNLEGGGDPTFYSYAYPVPAGFADRTVKPAQAHFDADLGEFVVTYASIRESEDPDEALLSFLQSTYEAAADLGGWERGALERDQGLLGRPPEGS